jgi:hypothetical protein
MKHYARSAMVAVACAAGVGASSAAYAHQDASCAQYDESDGMRCFDCLERVRTSHGWKYVDTCARKETSTR